MKPETWLAVFDNMVFYNLKRNPVHHPRDTIYSVSRLLTDVMELNDNFQVPTTHCYMNK